MTGERVTGGLSGAAVFRGRGVYRKVTPDAGVEAATLTWLRDHGVPVADVVDVGPDWLVTREDCRPGPPLTPGRRISVVLEARAAVASASVDVADLDEERLGWTPDALLAELTERLPIDTPTWR